MIWNGGESLIHLKAVLPFCQTGQAGELGEENNELQQGQVKGLAPGEG